MFRHMPVPRDTPVLHVHEIIIVCCESVGNCPTLSKVGPSQLVNNITFCPFFLLFASDGPRFLYLGKFFVTLRGTPTTCIVQLFISRDIQSCDCIFGFHGKEYSWIVWPSVWILSTYILINCEWFVIKLCGIGIINLTDLLCEITSYYFSIDVRFDCIFKHWVLNIQFNSQLMTEFTFKSSILFIEVK